MDRNTPAVEEIILPLCQEWTAAIRDRDDARLDAVMADDFTFTDERGRWGKAQFIANTRRWELVGMAFHDVVVRAYHEVAVLQARVAVQARLDGREMSGEWYLTDIWVRGADGWRVVARQWSRASPPAP